ncbi:MAG: hypothetical protein WC683_18840 [bacterium]
MNGEDTKAYYNHTLFTSILAILIGLVFLSYPGGPIQLIQLAFWSLQLIITVFVLAYTFSEAYASFKSKSKSRALLYMALGIVTSVIVWFFDVSIVYMIVALFLLFSGLVEIIGAVQLSNGRFFLALLGVLNIIMAAVMFKYPIILSVLLAWYILFWGVSRFFLALELRRLES